MKTIRIQKNWLVKAIKSGVLNVSDIPYKSWDEKAKIDAIISKIKVYWKDASKSLLSNMIIPSEKYTDAVFESIPSFIKSGILSENIENERVCLLVDSENIKGASFCIFYPKYNSYLLYVIKEEYLLMMMIKDDYAEFLTFEDGVLVDINAEALIENIDCDKYKDELEELREIFL